MTTLVVNTSQSGDSAYQASGGAVTLAGSGTSSSLSSSFPYAGCRFENITVAAGVTISSATLSLMGSGKALSLSAAIWKGVKQANPGVFTTTTSSVSTLYTGSPTTNSYSWTATLNTSTYVNSGDI